MRKKLKHGAAGFFAMLAIFLMGANIYEGGTFGLLLVDDGYAKSIYTEQETVYGLFQELGIDLYRFDQVNQSLEAQIHRGMVIEIMRARPVYIRIDDNDEFIRFYARPSAALVTIVADFSRDMGEDVSFLFDDNLARHRPNAGDIIDLRTVEWPVEYFYVEIPYWREYIESFFVAEGYHDFYQEGVPGLRRVAYHFEYISGERVYRGFAGYEDITMPYPEIVRMGIALPPYTAVSACGQLFTYNRLILMESTAYTLSFSCTGRHPGDPLFGVTASGMMAQVGVVAVDTRYIPFHTRMYIEGYGFAVAGDRGGAIRGYKVDVFFDTMAQALQWGRRHNVRVWILADEPIEYLSP